MDTCYSKGAYQGALKQVVVGDIQNHLQAMFMLLRPQDTIKLAVKLESMHQHRIRYMVVVSCMGRQDTQESLILGIDYKDSATIGLVLPLWRDTEIMLDGDGGFSVTRNDTTNIFKPVSVQAMWSALQCLHKNCDIARANNYFFGGLDLTWAGYYEAMITSEQSCINEWYIMKDLEVHRPDSPSYEEKRTEKEATEKLIKKKLRNIMMEVDIDNITSKQVRSLLQEDLNMDLKEYRFFIDEEMIIILRQMDAASCIFDHVYLGSEWNASNLEELTENGIGFILNLTKEIDNFYPGHFEYKNIRVYDVEETQLIRYWDETYKFMSKAKELGSKVLVHCKMGVSRSAATVMSYAMKEYGWSLDDTFKYVKDRRSVVNPNASFMRQLVEYQGILDASKQRHNYLWRSKSTSNLADEKFDNDESDFFPSTSYPDGCLTTDDLLTIKGRPRSWSPDEYTSNQLLRSMDSGEEVESLSVNDGKSEECQEQDVSKEISEQNKEAVKLNLLKKFEMPLEEDVQVEGIHLNHVESEDQPDHSTVAGVIDNGLSCVRENLLPLDDGFMELSVPVPVLTMSKEDADVPTNDVTDEAEDEGIALPSVTDEPCCADGNLAVLPLAEEEKSETEAVKEVIIIELDEPDMRQTVPDVPEVSGDKVDVMKEEHVDNEIVGGNVHVDEHVKERADSIETYVKECIQPGTVQRQKQELEERLRAELEDHGIRSAKNSNESSQRSSRRSSRASPLGSTEDLRLNTLVQESGNIDTHGEDAVAMETVCNDTEFIADVSEQSVPEPGTVKRTRDMFYRHMEMGTKGVSESISRDRALSCEKNVHSDESAKSSRTSSVGDAELLKIDLGNSDRGVEEKKDDKPKTEIKDSNEEDTPMVEKEDGQLVVIAGEEIAYEPGKVKRQAQDFELRRKETDELSSPLEELIKLVSDEKKDTSEKVKIRIIEATSPRDEHIVTSKKSDCKSVDVEEEKKQGQEIAVICTNTSSDEEKSCDSSTSSPTVKKKSESNNVSPATVKVCYRNETIELPAGSVRQQREAIEGKTKDTAKNQDLADLQHECVKEGRLTVEELRKIRGLGQVMLGCEDEGTFDVVEPESVRTHSCSDENVNLLGTPSCVKTIAKQFEETEIKRSSSIAKMSDEMLSPDVVFVPEFPETDDADTITITAESSDAMDVANTSTVKGLVGKYNRQSASLDTETKDYKHDDVFVDKTSQSLDFTTSEEKASVCTSETACGSSKADTDSQETFVIPCNRTTGRSAFYIPLPNEQSDAPVARPRDLFLPSEGSSQSAGTRKVRFIKKCDE
ncbi:uncharacterized protein LOC100376065 [Saccoglossus kowalevskii]|uniref:protein-serine/threonine phosphatase n=1 Tax=Saccoglossus kowalevskii TaxID=10224 RepID=A0ABM0MDK6_SACKO|nr:PREDICTED: protein phosphatase Slingshot homolog 2-like [Saccoglossus kowalevskii]